MTDPASRPVPPAPPVSRDALLSYLDALGLATRTHDHAPVFTVDEGEHIKAALPGAHTKNLFLKDKKDNLVLVSAAQDTVVDLKTLHRRLGLGRFSFGSAERLEAALGVTPGSVTAFAIINDPHKQVRFVLDARLMEQALVNFHPLRNDATTAIASADLLHFVRALGREPEILPLGPDEAE
ncbi:prolyl-tRNA synthetase associated domain-containing protein [Marinicauda sp. Alg238-R41]|uniref:prolyl-tRNA synthetase associated domain-containing protein n=1 Tax=Marinicauda sp. Alg238-R41 TaxID=2993447 RepID=UPI0022E59BCA|nr:prolyl-tRNA synthetase associated domain-containing protein [Marinicauda sp. Alg238-R41]